MYAKNMLKSVKENLVVYGVESCGKIQQRENRNFIIIKRQQEVIHYFQECSFSGVTGAVRVDNKHFTVFNHRAKFNDVGFLVIKGDNLTIDSVDFGDTKYIFVV
nr:hypothetical protein BaRGS_017540 [Batillaria attramentaria]